jgi:hypothetical protein
VSADVNNPLECRVFNLFNIFQHENQDRHSLTNFHFDQHPGCLQMCSGRKQAPWLSNPHVCELVWRLSFLRAFTFSTGVSAWSITRLSFRSCWYIRDSQTTWDPLWKRGVNYVAKTLAKSCEEDDLCGIPWDPSCLFLVSLLDSRRSWITSEIQALEDFHPRVTYIVRVFHWFMQFMHIVSTYKVRLDTSDIYFFDLPFL